MRVVCEHEGQVATVAMGFIVQRSYAHCIAVANSKVRDARCHGQFLRKGKFRKFLQ